MNLPEDLRYAKTHEWARRGKTVRVGITDHAQQEITDVVHVELPKIGRKVTAADPCAVVESVKAAFDMYAPVTGEISAVNQDLLTHPELVNQDPYGKGWFFEITPSDPSDYDRLLRMEQYRDSLGHP